MKPGIRSVPLILDRLATVEDLRKTFHEKHWGPWFKKAREIKPILNGIHGTFWGIINNKDSEGYPFTERILFKIDGYSYSCGVPSSKIEMTLIEDDDKLPLHMDDPAFDMDILERRLKGDLKGLPYRQDLTDEYVRLTARSDHQNIVFGGYEKELFTWFYVDLVLGKNRIVPHRLVILKRKGRTFCIDFKEKRLIRSDEMVLKDY